jgi:hypothetical protein
VPPWADQRERSSRSPLHLHRRHARFDARRPVERAVIEFRHRHRSFACGIVMTPP